MADNGCTCPAEQPPFDEICGWCRDKIEIGDFVKQPNGSHVRKCQCGYRSTTGLVLHWDARCAKMQPAPLQVEITVKGADLAAELADIIARIERLQGRVAAGEFVTVGAVR